VVWASWNDTKAYVEWPAHKTGKSCRLLSEAEWEYVASGEMSPCAYPRFWFGDDEQRTGLALIATLTGGVMGRLGGCHHFSRSCRQALPRVVCCQIGASVLHRARKV
jgi:hypothetical protein